MSTVKICPKCGAIAEWDSYFGGTRCTRCDFVEKPKPTNADRIRAMSDEELAKVFDRASSCPPGEVEARGGDCYRPRYECRDCWLEWLKREADSGRA